MSTTIEMLRENNCSTDLTIKIGNCSIRVVLAKSKILRVGDMKALPDLKQLTDEAS